MILEVQTSGKIYRYENFCKVTLKLDIWFNLSSTFVISLETIFFEEFMKNSGIVISKSVKTE